MAEKVEKEKEATVEGGGSGDEAEEMVQKLKDELHAEDAQLETEPAKTGEWK